MTEPPSTPPRGSSEHRWSFRLARASRRRAPTSGGSLPGTPSGIPGTGRDSTLRSRALVSVTIAATLGTREPLRGQLRIALNNGVTKDEIVDLFIHLEAYAGAARAFDSYQVALRRSSRKPRRAVAAGSAQGALAGLRIAVAGCGHAVVGPLVQDKAGPGAGSGWMFSMRLTSLMVVQT